MSNKPTTLSIILWYFRRQTLIGRLKASIWLCAHRRNYVRLYSALRQLVARRKKNSATPERNNPDISCETPRLILRTLQTSDLDAVANLLPPPDTDAKSTSPTRRKQWRRELSLAAELLEARLNIVAVHKASQEVIGLFAITRYHIDGQPRYELGYQIHFAHYGNGYATEGAMAIRDFCFETLGLKELISLISPSNHASIRVAQKNGMRFEGEWKKQIGVVHIYSMKQGEISSDVSNRDPSVNVD